MHVRTRHSGARGRRAMEIAAVMMIAAVLLGIAQQFDNPVW